jgi:hypothetical protein
VLDALCTLRQRLVHGGLELSRLTTPVGAVGGHDQLGRAVLDTGPNRFRRESSEDHGVDRADACAGQHRDDSLRDHGEVDRNAVPLLDSEFLERVGRLRHLVLEVSVGVRPAVSRLALEVNGHPVAVACLDMAVNGVICGVELAVLEPFGERGIGPVESLCEFLVPVEEPLGLFGPELGSLGRSLFVEVAPGVRLGGELLGRVERVVSLAHCASFLVDAVDGPRDRSVLL